MRPVLVLRSIMEGIVDGIHHLRVLIANQRSDRLELLAQVVTGLGHEVIAREIHVSDVAAVTANRSGLEALPDLRRPASGARIIVLSGFATGTVADEVASLGAHAYLEKGADPDTIVAAIQAAVADTRQVPAGTPG